MTATERSGPERCNDESWWNWFPGDRGTVNTTLGRNAMRLRVISLLADTSSRIRPSLGLAYVGCRHWSDVLRVEKQYHFCSHRTCARKCIGCLYLRFEQVILTRDLVFRFGCAVRIWSPPPAIWGEHQTRDLQGMSYKIGKEIHNNS